MKMLVTGAALLLLVAACSDTDSWRSEAATAIGTQLANRLAEPLDQAANTGREGDLEGVMDALDEALDDIALPTGVRRMISGSHLASTLGGGYADVWLPLVIVPTESADLFCMVFALSSTGELVAEPARGDPIDRCGETEKPRLTAP